MIRRIYLFGCAIFVIYFFILGCCVGFGASAGSLGGLSSSSSWKRSGWLRLSVQVMGCPIFGLFFPFELS